MASFARSTAGRAVHLKITPRPSNLGESREILRLISQFGDIEYFKNLKYDVLSHPNTSLVIFKNEEAAKECLKRSPIRFRMGKAPVEEETPRENKSLPSPSTPAPVQPEQPAGHAPWGLPPPVTPSSFGQTRSMSTRSLPDPPARPQRLPFETPPPPPPLLDSRIFQIQTNPSRANFRDQITYGAYHGSFAVSTRSIPFQNLHKAVPNSGMSCVDWRAEDRPWRIVDKEIAREREGPQRRKSLRELYEEGPEGVATFRDESIPG